MNENKRFYYGVFAGVLICIAMLLLVIVVYGKRDTPTAMDVYQGKTTLEITYKDGVAVDSTVVFKDKK